MRTITICFFGILIAAVACRKQRIKNQCCSEPSLNIQFDSGYIAIPNVFTPNGDGINDNLRFLGQGIKEFQIRIKNKLGKTIFETNDINTYWNGKYKNKIQEGLFNYHIELITVNDESIKGSGKICSFFNVDKLNNKSYCFENAANCKFGEQWNGEEFSVISEEKLNFYKCN